MPYIKSDNDRREKLRDGAPALTAGELNYQIFRYVKHNVTKEQFGFNQKQSNIIKYFVDQFLGKNPNYQKYNDMTGALIRCMKEIKRRLNIDARMLKYIMNLYDDEIAKYEDLKCSQNGDVE